MSSDEPAKHPNPADHWKNRRRIAYISLIHLSLIFIAILLDRITEPNVTLVQTLAWVYATLIVGYISNAAFEAWVKRGKP